MKDFESTPDFQALVVAASGRPERSMGDSVIPAEPPQWSEVRRLALNLLSTAANQLPLHVYLVQAEASVNGFTGFHSSLQTTLQLLQDQWDEVHPEPDPDDPDDRYYARVNLISELSEQPAFLDTIYRLPLVKIRGIGDFSTRDLDISAGTVAGSSEDQVRCQDGLIRGAFARSEPTQLQVMADALDALPGLCRAFETVFAEKTGQANALSLDRLRKRIEACRVRFHEFADEHLVTSPTDVTVGDSPVDVTDQRVSASTSEPVLSSSIGNRETVIASFTAILVYYQQREPSSPVPVLTALARDIVDKSFFEVLQAMAPANRDDLSTLLLQLQKKPLAALLSDSYTHYLSGERLSALPVPVQPSEPTPPETPAVDLDIDTGSPPDTSPVSSGVSGNSHSELVISSRQQVLEVLHDIETYFVNAEPASPIPLIVADIRKLVPKRFEELIAEFSHLLSATSTEPGV
jgi:type VI secretion system protein ImpA